jgi:hypothetical protein
MATMVHKERFTGHTQSKRSPLGDSKGWVYNLGLGGQSFHIRVYDEAPRRALVVVPLTARTSPLARKVVDFLLADGCTEVQFHFKEGLYRTVDPKTLEFL